MTKRSLDASAAAAHIKRHCAAVIEQTAKRPAPDIAFGEAASKRLCIRKQELPADHSSESVRQEGWLAGHAEGLEEGNRKATEVFSSEVVPEIEKVVKAAVDDLNAYYNSMFLELCREFSERSSNQPRFIY